MKSQSLDQLCTARTGDLSDRVVGPDSFSQELCEFLDKSPK
jgi:hypothetical protein